MKTTFTQVEDDFIRENYLVMPIKTIGKEINRSFCGISGRLKALGLKIPPELAAERKAKGMFRKGQIPPNKGKKMEEYMSPENLAVFRSNQFKKNHIPHNAKENWEEVQRKDKQGNVYYMIKLPEKRKLVYKHIWMWEEENGKVPKAHNIVFKNGNSLDCTPENLECLSNAELMSRNTIHRYPDDLKQAIRRLGKIKKHIKNESAKHQ